jgi:dsDNA-binding SOS-regulon protein
MVLYAESLLVMLYSIYLKHQTKVGLDEMQLEDFRLMFEEEQEALSKLLEDENPDLINEIETEKKVWH